MKISENFQKFVEIFLFLFLFFRITDQFITQLWNIKLMLNIFQNLFELFGGFSGFYSDFWDKSVLEIPRGPQGIDFIFLNLREM